MSEQASKGTARICRRCGAALLPRAPAGLCPKCLLGQAVESSAQSAHARAAAAAPPEPLLPEASARHFGDYELIEKIAAGGMGIVYKARQLSLNRIVALKMVLGGPLASAAERQRFLDEAQTAASLQHPNIIAIHEVGEHAGQPFFSMDHVEGRSLAEVLRHGPLPPRRAAGYAKTIAEAVAYAHQRGVLHRDLKPSNVLIDQSDQPRITDFGLAKRLTGDSDLTVSGQVLGSPSFMAPEQAQGRHREIGPPSDVYSLGALLYHLLTGRPPFQAATLTEVLRQVVTTEPPAPRLLNPSLPRDLETICLKCLEKEAPRRYQTASALAEELGRFLEGKPILARPVGTAVKAWKWCRRRPAMAGMGAGLVLTFLVGLGGVLWQWRRAATGESQARQNAQAEFRQRYAADMHLAQLALERNNRFLAVNLLNKYRPAGSSPASRSSSPAADPRGWEWRYLWQLCQSDELLALHRYPQGINALAVAKGAEILAVATYDGVALWDLKTRQPWAPLPVGGANALSFSPTDHLLAVGRWNGRGEPVVELWDLNAGKPTKVRSYPTGNYSLAFSPDGKLLASFDSAGSVRITDWASGQHLHEFEVAPLRETWAGVVQFSPDGRQLAIGEDFGLLRIFDLQTRTFMTNETKGAESVNSLAFSAASGLLAAGLGYGEGTIGLWDTRSGALLGELTNHTDFVTALVFSADGRELLSASNDGTIRVWSVADRVERHCLQSPGEGLRALVMLPDGRTLVSGGVEGSVCFWDTVATNQATSHTSLALWEGLESLRGLERRAFESATLDPRVVQRLGLTFTPDSRNFITMDERTGVLTRWDARAWRRVESLPALGSNHWGVALSPDGHWLATGDLLPPRVTLRDWSTLQVVTNSPVPIEVFGILRFSPSGHYLLALTLCNSWRPSVRLWRVADWAEVTLSGQQFQGVWGMLDLSPDDRFLAVGFANGAVKLFHFPSFELAKELGYHKAAVNGVLFSRDGRMLASTSADGSARLWGMAANQPVALLRGHASWVWGFGFSPDGLRLATGGTSSRDAVKLWDLSAERELLSLPAKGAYFFGVGFSPDGNTLVAMCASGLAHLWRAPSWADIEAAEKKQRER